MQRKFASLTLASWLIVALVLCVLFTLNKLHVEPTPHIRPLRNWAEVGTEKGWIIIGGARKPFLIVVVKLMLA